MEIECLGSIQKWYYQTFPCANVLEVFPRHASTILGVLRWDFRGINVAEMHIFPKKNAPKSVWQMILSRKLHRNTFWIAPRDSACLNYPDTYFSSHLKSPSRRTSIYNQEGHSLPPLKKESVIYIYIIIYFFNGCLALSKLYIWSKNQFKLLIRLPKLHSRVHFSRWIDWCYLKLRTITSWSPLRVISKRNQILVWLFVKNSMDFFRKWTGSITEMMKYEVAHPKNISYFLCEHKNTLIGV